MLENCTQMELFPEMEGSTSSLPVSLARTFQLQEIKQELKQIEADYFSKLPAYQTRSSPIAELDPRLCWRTSQTSLLETGEVGQEPYTGSWPAEGIVLNGKLWGQKMWEHLTGGIDGGASHIWPTPAANPPGWKNIEVVDKDGNYPTHINQRFYDKKTGRLVQKGLEQVVQWPIPTVSDTEGGLVKNVEMENGSFSRKNQDGVRWGVKLKDAVNHVEKKNWPTPTARDGKSGKGEQDRKYSELSPAIERQHLQGNLNADWVEALMGYPPGWTSLDDGETDPGRKESPE